MQSPPISCRSSPTPTTSPLPSRRCPSYSSWSWSPATPLTSPPTSSHSSRPSSPPLSYHHPSPVSSCLPFLDSTSSSPDAIQLIHVILDSQSLYQVLGVHNSASFDDIRRAYLFRSRLVHPDKHPNNPLATQAFQRVASAYSTLRQASTRAAYDLDGDKVPGSGDETLYTTLVQIWFEFVEGNFDSLLMMADILNYGKEDISHESLKVLLQSIRSLMDTCSQCIVSAKPGFFHALDLHSQLCSLPYLDIVGRIKLSLQLLHVLLTIPLTINIAAGGNTLPNWSVSTLQAMITLIESAQTTSSKIMNITSKLGPIATRDALKSVFIAGPLQRASNGIRSGLESLVTWRPWYNNNGKNNNDSLPSPRYHNIIITATTTTTTTNTSSSLNHNNDLTSTVSSYITTI